ncbi:MAG: histidinol dehydrogenase [Chloroflexi bacterium]|nr:histidinol dehydrogenase [Chloroflexota bacterium]
MIEIFTVEQAQQTILTRKPFGREDYAPKILERTAAIFGEGVSPQQAVKQIITTIENEGDPAVRKWSALLDGFEGKEFAVPQAEIEQAYADVPIDVKNVLNESARRIRKFHEKQPISSWISGEMGGQMGQRFTPINRVGVYVPGGTAPLPSSLLMSVIPAQVAGVSDLIVCTPPVADPLILAAAKVCEVSDVFQIGGAQAIAAMAFGTNSVPRVDKVVGAGNLFVTLAKQQLYGVIGLDGLAGPTETMLIADSSANPIWVAADLLAQAEHDVQASVILLTPDKGFARKVRCALTEQIQGLSRKKIIMQSISNNGGIVITDSMEQAVELANEYAAEHLCLSVADPQFWMDKITNAGGIFLGVHSYEVLGDYVAGPSHVMPTNGTARFASPLSVLDFVKISTVIDIDLETRKDLSPIAAEFARIEGLTAHAAAARLRMEDPSEL